MPWLALALVSAFLVIVFPVRAARRRRLFGSAARAVYRRGRRGSWVLADLLFVGGFALVVAGPALQAAGVTGAPLDTPAVLAWVAAGSIVLAAALAIWSQETMGSAWRPDIAPARGSQLVTGGPFSVVRNPTYVAMLVAGMGTLLLAPSACGVIGWLSLLAGLLLTARAEEPQLRAVYGAQYGRYAARVGRLLPLIGRLCDASEAQPPAGAPDPAEMAPGR